MDAASLTVTVDKFSFRIPQGLLYSDEGVWVKFEGNRARLGLSDFLQQHSGDVTFVNTKPVGTALKPGDEFADIETIKVNVSLGSPVQGALIEVNPSLRQAAELVNQDPYDKGWVAIVELTNEERAHLLDADRYAALVRSQAEAEMKA